MVTSTQREKSGIDGFDAVLHGGFVPNQSYLISGDPGAGKTLLSIEYLLEGVENGESTLFINLGENQAAIHRTAENFGWDLSAIEFLDLSPTSERFTDEETYSIFSPAEVERETFTDEVTDVIDDISPNRVVIDPVTQFRHLAPDEYQFRQQFLAFLDYLLESEATVLFTSQRTDDRSDEDLSFLGDGTIELNATGPVRKLQVKKFRSSPFQAGEHSYSITDDGFEVYPKLAPGEHDRSFTGEVLSSGVPEIDSLLRGGIMRGTATIISGPSGVGKTTFGTQFIKEAAGRGDVSTIYLLEETGDTFRNRSEAVNIPIAEMERQGSIEINEIEALTMSPDEFAHLVRKDVEERGSDIVMIDGVQGYRQTIEGSDYEMINELHALIRFLKNAGVTVVMTSEVPNVTGDFEPTDFGGSYLADTLIFQRHIEIEGAMRKAIGVLKKRTSDYERTLREFSITENGVTVGEPLTQLRGILTGTPELVDEPRKATQLQQSGDGSVEEMFAGSQEVRELRELLSALDTEQR